VGGTPSKGSRVKSTLVMTGASRGIGRIAAQHILRRSPETQLLVVARGSTGAVPGADVVTADLRSLQAVRSAAAEIGERLDSGELPPLRGFVGNAGVQYTNALTAGPGGFEATFTVNVLAQHLLVRLLEDRFTAPARLVTTVSDTHFGDFRHNLGMVPGPEWRSPEVLARPGAFARPETAAAGRTAYSTSKLAAIHLVHEYARRLPPGIDVVSFNPGFVPGTGLDRDAGAAARFALRRLLPAMTLTPFATSPRAAGRHLADVVLGRTPAASGEYVDRDRVVPSSAESYDPEREAALWETVERLTAQPSWGNDSPDRP
jgi:NAD(P)-dependent dehydrogenase (short-subunit alcohol dehydrogenase family)